MQFKIEEPVIVAAIFKRKPLIKPVWFMWRDKKYRVQEVTYSWSDSDGQVKRHHFAVSDGANIYQLCYNTKLLNWKLLAVDMVS